MAVKRPYAPVRAAMSGQVNAIYVETGAIADEGEQILAIEAMKLLMYCESPLRGEVEILVGPHEMVEADQVVAKVYPV